MKAPYLQACMRALAPIFLILTLGIVLHSCVIPTDTEKTVIVYDSYVPPPWAPPYDNVSAVRYYYLPDYDIFFDVWQGAFCYQTGAVWICSRTLPPMYTTIDLRGVFIVLIDRDVYRPWDHDRYYRDNYPPHCYDRYRDIVEHDRIIPNLPHDRELVPRAFNENSDRVTFMQHPVERAMPPSPAPTPNPSGRAPAPAPGRSPAPTPERVAVPAPIKPTTPNYDRMVHEVPMKAIAPSMPQASKKFNYGSGYAKEAKQK